MNQQYSEDTETRRYVGRWYNHLLTESERLGPSAEWLLKNVPNASPEEIEAVIHEQFDGSEQRLTVMELLTAIDRFTEQSISRILRDHASEIALTRCPDCARIVSSPNAKQCLWCGNDWHAASSAKGLDDDCSTTAHHCD